MYRLRLDLFSHFKTPYPNYNVDTLAHSRRACGQVGGQVANEADNVG
jgi:hypothetical protein